MHFSGAGLAGCENAVLTEGQCREQRPNQIVDSFWSTTEEDAEVLEAWIDAYRTKLRSVACINVGH